MASTGGAAPIDTPIVLDPGATAQEHFRDFFSSVDRKRAEEGCVCPITSAGGEPMRLLACRAEAGRLLCRRNGVETFHEPRFRNCSRTDECTARSNPWLRRASAVECSPAWPKHPGTNGEAIAESITVSQVLVDGLVDQSGASNAQNQIAVGVSVLRALAISVCARRRISPKRGRAQLRGRPISKKALVILECKEAFEKT